MSKAVIEALHLENLQLLGDQPAEMYKLAMASVLSKWQEPLQHVASIYYARCKGEIRGYVAYDTPFKERILLSRIVTKVRGQRYSLVMLLYEMEWYLETFKRKQGGAE